MCKATIMLTVFRDGTMLGWDNIENKHPNMSVQVTTSPVSSRRSPWWRNASTKILWPTSGATTGRHQRFQPNDSQLYNINKVVFFLRVRSGTPSCGFVWSTVAEDHSRIFIMVTDILLDSALHHIIFVLLIFLLRSATVYLKLYIQMNEFKESLLARCKELALPPHGKKILVLTDITELLICDM